MASQLLRAHSEYCLDPELSTISLNSEFVSISLQVDPDVGICNVSFAVFPDFSIQINQ